MNRIRTGPQVKVQNWGRATLDGVGEELARLYAGKGITWNVNDNALRTVHVVVNEVLNVRKHLKLNESPRPEQIYYKGTVES